MLAKRDNAELFCAIEVKAPLSDAHASFASGRRIRNVCKSNT